jgi:hypothetical protein
MGGCFVPWDWVGLAKGRHGGRLEGIPSTFLPLPSHAHHGLFSWAMATLLSSFIPLTPEVREVF